MKKQYSLMEIDEVIKYQEQLPTTYHLQIAKWLKQYKELEKENEELKKFIFDLGVKYGELIKKNYGDLIKENERLNKLCEETGDRLLLGVFEVEVEE